MKPCASRRIGFRCEWLSASLLPRRRVVGRLKQWKMWRVDVNAVLHWPNCGQNIRPLKT
jgi:hypothetical protein